MEERQGRVEIHDVPRFSNFFFNFVKLVKTFFVFCLGSLGLTSSRLDA